MHHLFGGAHFVCKYLDGLGAFGMSDKGCVGVLISDFGDRGVCPLHVHITVALPERHRPAGLFHHPLAEIFVRHKEEILVRRTLLHNFLGVAAGANNIRECLHFGAAVDIGDGEEIRVGCLQFTQFGRRTTFLQRTAGIAIGQDHRLVWRQNFRRFRHEMHAAENDHIGMRFRRLLR